MSDRGPTRGRTGLARHSVVALAGALALVLLARVTALPENLLFFWPAPDPGPPPPGAVEIRLPGPGAGSELHAWLFSPPGSTPDMPLPVVIHVHGNAGALDAHTEFCVWLAQQQPGNANAPGVRVLLFDYRGYGRSSGAGYLTRRTLIDDAKAAYRFTITQPWADAGRVVLFGNSIGAVTAINAAAELREAGQPPRAVVAAAPFATWPGVAAFHAGFLGRALIRPGSDARHAAARLGTVPLLTLHGSADTVTPPADSATIADTARAAGVDATTALHDGLDHISLLLDELVRAEVSAWLDRHLAREP